MSRVFGLGLASMLLLVSACTSQRVAEIEKPPTTKFALNEYQIGIGDALQISVWRNPDLSMAVPVRPDGKISLPLVGDVQAIGNTTERLSANIAAALGSYIKNPQVTVIVTSSGSSDFRNRVRVTGAVNSQLSIPFREGMTVLDVVLEAGGPSEFAAANRTKLYRETGNGIKVYPIYLDDILNKGKLESNYELGPSDIVTIPERVF